jgi:Zn-dependent protease
MARGPWDEPETPAPGRGPGHSGAPGGPLRSQRGAPAAPTAGNSLVWNLVSTLLLAAFLAWQMGPIVALGGVVGVLVHELGHILAMNALGCGPARMVIIPFLGGAAIPARAPETEFKDVLISLAGPVFGLLAMAPFFLAYAVTGQTAWFQGAFFVAFINLLNLVPAPPLDGSKALGPALAKVHPMLERVALLAVGAIGVAWALSRNSWIMAFFIGIGVLGVLRRGAIRPYALRLTPREFAYALALYIAAAALCLLGLGVALVGLNQPLSFAAFADVLGF